ncbi:DivIVA domain-containing protein [Kribbella sp. NPDC051620]|uniref:DivIVA domain-containing protein n=1 Tax=Kribbella sp. NPDC051620 TaxID=3364120 RepID=UPI0037B1FA78
MWFFGLIVVLLIGAVAVVASGRWGAMAPAYDDRPDLTVPARQALTADDLETARFGVGLRGYRMDEVDTLLERVAREVAERDRRIADLERAVSPIIHGPEGAGFTARADYHPTDFDDTGYNKPILVGGDFPTPEEPPAAVQPEPTPAAVAETAAAPEAPAVPAAEAPPAPEAPAKPQAQVDTQLPAEVHAEQPAQPTAVTEAPSAPAADDVPAVPAADEVPAVPAADEVPAEPWFEEAETSSVLDERPQAPVPLPPMLQELVHTTEDAEPESWFTAKEPPPEYSEEVLAENTAATPADPTDADPDRADTDRAGTDGDDDEDESGELPRGRHSASPDVSAVQRPN